ncbi:MULTISPECIES: helix-turn-helix transcriptional regulator [unclassified Devosia]|uniref:helix-turn-helix domain-containing protein n=1 Tax=unclassified Devosia TaxID=196773 RepID=UPI001556D1B4|nr:MULTISPECIES: helix-turn-helix transcriptional regulator [unclassified Devosia]
MTDTLSIGELIAGWRRRRRMSQLELALEAGISQRHLSFLESGRSRPSRDMVLRLSEQMSVPMRERNALLVAAGHAPSFREQSIDHIEMAAARQAVQSILDGHRPHPALALDRHWNLLLANAPALRLMDGADASLAQAPVNVLRLSLHPRGLAARIINYRHWKAHIVQRLIQQIELTGDQELVALLDEIRSFPVPAKAEPHSGKVAGGHPIAVPLRLASPQGVLSFLSTTTIFGSALDITLSELTIETFFPADPHTAEVMRLADL